MADRHPGYPTAGKDTVNEPCEDCTMPGYQWLFIRIRCIGCYIIVYSAVYRKTETTIWLYSAGLPNSREVTKWCTRCANVEFQIAKTLESTSIRHFRVGSMSNRYRSEVFAYQGIWSFNGADYNTNWSKYEDILELHSLSSSHFLIVAQKAVYFSGYRASINTWPGRDLITVLATQDTADDRMWILKRRLIVQTRFDCSGKRHVSLQYSQGTQHKYDTFSYTKWYKTR